MPKVSVIMPVLNGEKYLKEAIESVLNQTHKDFEFIIINDGSTDRTEEIIKSYTDRRIVYIKNDKNQGLSKSFNTGIRAARGEYLARMDADDVALPGRFRKQLGLLADGKADLVGSAVILIDEKSHGSKLVRRPESHLGIKWHALFSTPLIHPTVMARARVLKDNPYDESLHNSEDYELWSRLLFETDTKLANIGKPLLYYRVYQGSFTQKLDQEKRATSAQNSINNIERYTKLSDREKEALIRLRKGQGLRIGEYFIIWSMYLRAATKFGTLGAYWSLLPLSLSLKKRWLKQLLG